MTKATGKRRAWTESEIAFMKANPDMSIKGFMTALNRCKSSVDKMRAVLGIRSDRTKPWSEEERRILEQSAHLPNKSLGLILGRTASQVSSARYYRGHRMQRKCVMCGGHFVSPHAAAKICSTCNPYPPGSQRSPIKRLEMYVRGAKKRGIEFRLTTKEFFGFWRKPCTYCGTQIETVGIDRVDSDRGYVASNVVACCHRCNTMKNDASVDGWLDDMKRALKHMGEI